MRFLDALAFGEVPLDSPLHPLLHAAVLLEHGVPAGFLLGRDPPFSVQGRVVVFPVNGRMLGGPLEGLLDQLGDPREARDKDLRVFSGLGRQAVLLEALAELLGWQLS